MSLTQAQKTALVLERNPFPDPAGKAQAVVALLRCSMSDYEQFLSDAVDDPEAAVFAPDVVEKVLNAREARSQRGKQASLFSR